MITLTKYEQSAFAVRVDGQVLAVDFGSMTSAESLAAAGTPTWSLVSHIHFDHFSEPNLRRLGAPVLTVSQVAQEMSDKQKLPVTLIRAGQTVKLEEGLEVTAAESDHGPKPPRPLENVGFVIAAEGKRIYFLGDMGAPTPPPEGTFDLVLAPIGYNTGYVFSAEAAADYLHSIGFAGLAVPVHYNGSADGDAVERFEKAAQGFAVRVLGRGESLEVA